MFLCDKCGLFYSDEHRCNITFKCNICRRKFKIIENYNKHVDKCSRDDVVGLFSNDRFELTKSAFGKWLAVYNLKDLDFKDMAGLILTEKESLFHLLQDVLNKLECIKFQIGCWLTVSRPNPEKEEKKTTYVCSAMKTLCSNEFLELKIEESFNEMDDWIDRFTQEGSGWTVEKIKELEIRVAKYVPHEGGCFTAKLPDKIKNKKALINIETNSDCFAYSVIASLHPVDKHVARTYNYEKYFNNYDFSDVRGHVKLNDITKFEKKNSICVNVYTLSIDESSIIPLKVNSMQNQHQINLLLYNDHYYCIKNFNRLLNNGGKKGMKRCLRCLHGFKSETQLSEHVQYCNDHAPQRVLLPAEGEKIEFKDFKKMMKRPFIIYADFETLATKIDDHKTRTSFEYQEHKPCSYGLVVVDWNGKIILQDFYRGVDAADYFLKSLIAVGLELEEIYEKNQKELFLTDEEEALFYLTDNCHICKQKFDSHDEKVRDHCHLTGKFRGAAHDNCNLQFKWDHKIPVVFHNLKNFDGHLLIQAFQKEYFRSIKMIPQTIEKYISIMSDQFIFIDSFGFLPSSLDNLAKNIDEKAKTNYLKQVIDGEDVSLLLKKACLPYEYLDNLSKFDELQLPPSEAFYSSLTNKTIDEDVYERLHKIWKTFNCQNLGDFHDIYLKVDVALLAAVFENFRAMSLKEFRLDPAHYFSIPGLTWAAALKMTDAKLDHMTDIDMILMLERGIRGGISSAMKRHVTANNPSCSNHDPKQPKSYITYLDVNNLYGYSLKQKLPYGKFAWVEPDNFQKVLNEITSNVAKHGYILEVDMDYPKELHDWHDDYPLAVEKMSINDEQLSPYQQDLVSKYNENGRKRIKSKKLIPNLYEKRNYVLHYQNLRYYLSKGLQLKKIHRIIQFEEKAWLEPYIELCTSKRKQAATSFEKDFWKLMVNSLYGKSIEDKRKHTEVRFLCDKKMIKKYIAKPLFDQFCILDENRVISKLRKSLVKLDKPISVGFTVLEYAKLHMYRLHYDTFKAHYGNDIQLVYTDTDSFIYHIKTDNFYKDLEQFKDIMDFCDYPKVHPLYTEVNKKKLGYLKDEMNGKPIYEVIALKSKLYIIISEDGEKKTAKGVQKSVVAAEITRKQYYDCLYEQKFFYNTTRRLQSNEHKIKAIETNKMTFSPLDDKRWAINAIETHAFGHYLTKQET